MEAKNRTTSLAKYSRGTAEAGFQAVDCLAAGISNFSQYPRVDRWLHLCSRKRPSLREHLLDPKPPVRQMPSSLFAAPQLPVTLFVSYSILVSSSWFDILLRSAIVLLVLRS